MDEDDETEALYEDNVPGKSAASVISRKSTPVLENQTPAAIHSPSERPPESPLTSPTPQRAKKAKAPPPAASARKASTRKAVAKKK